MKIKLLFCALALPFLTLAQANLDFEPSYQIASVDKPLSISKDRLDKAQTLTELNPYYETKADWVKEYIAVEISAKQQGETKKASSKSNQLSPEQKAILATADMGSDISVNVQYLPENSLTEKEVRTLDFSFVVNPENEATFPGGTSKLNQYLKENMMEKVAASSFKQHNLTAVKFTIDKTGQVIDAHIAESSKDETVDATLLEAICNMPRWKPAAYTNGTKTTQEFALMVGDMQSCVVNLLNIRRTDWEEIIQQKEGMIKE